MAPSCDIGERLVSYMRNAAVSLTDHGFGRCSFCLMRRSYSPIVRSEVGSLMWAWC